MTGAGMRTVPADNGGSVELIDAHCDRLGDLPHVVYRLLDANGVPLYIGCTVDLEKRLREQRTITPLWQRTARVVTERYATRPEALAAERAAIRAECPCWNVHWNQGVTAVAEAMFLEAHTYPARNVIEAWDYGREHHEELVRRVRERRGDVAGSFPIEPAVVS